MSKNNKLFRNRVLLGASISAMAVSAQPAYAQCVPNPDGSCTITNTGVAGDISATQPTIILNTGTAGAISQSGGGFLVVDNRAGGTVGSAVFSGPASPPPNGPTGNVFINSGTVSGDVTFNDSDIAGGIFVNDGGTVTGSVTTVLIGSPEGQGTTFINRTGPGTGVGGALDFVGAYDSFLTSFGSTSSHDLSAALPTSFEYGGVEARGASTVVTLTGVGDGVSLAGDGHIINESTIGAADFWVPDIGSIIGTSDGTFENFAVRYLGVVGQESQIIAYVDPVFGLISLRYGDALSSFTNNGTINGDLTDLRTASFTNTGVINLRSSDFGTTIVSAAGEDFSFTNSGLIEMANTDLRALPFATIFDEVIALSTALNAVTLDAVTITNSISGEISGGLAFSGVASNFTFNNAGLIAIGDNPNGIDRAVEIDLGRLQYALNPDFIEDAIADTVVITNSGTLDGGIEGDFSTRSLSFTNTATGYINSDVNDAEAAAVELSTDDWPAPGGGEDVNDADTFTFLNQGTIVGAVGLDANATLVTFTNSGSITQALRPENGIYVNPSAEDPVAIVQETTLGATLSFTNTGMISNADYGGGAVYIELEAGSISSGIPAAATANATVNVTNSGTIRAAGGSYVTAGYDGIPTGQAKIDFSNALDITTDAEGTSSVTITNQQGGLIDARGEYHVGTPGGPISVTGQPADQAGMAISAYADQVTIVNRGTILGSSSQNGTLVANDGTILVPIVHDGRDFEGVLGTAIDTFGGTDDITNAVTGVIEGGVALRSGDDIFRNYGILKGNLNLGAGDDTFIQGVSAIFVGVADGGAGTDTFILDLTGGGTINGSIYNQLVNFETLTTVGSGAVDIDGTDGTDGLSNEGTLNGNVALGGGNDTFTQNGTINGNVSLGTGNDSLIQKGIINGNVDLGEGDDSLQNTGTINGPVDLGSGDNSFDNSAGGTIKGNVVSGTGNDQLANAGSIVGDIYLDGAGEDAAAKTTAAFTLMAAEVEAAIAPTGGDDVLANSGTVDGNIFAGGGNDQLTNSGTVTGLIDLGEGDDVLLLTGDWAIGGEVNGGAGTDQVQVTFAGVPAGEAAPILDLGGFTQIEQFTVNGGDSAIGGTAAFDLIDIQSGNLTIAPEAVISGNVNVANGSTFGNAGALEGDVTFGSANNSFTQTGTITGDVLTGAGNDQLHNQGSITGLIDLGEGDDTLLLTGDWAIGGEVNGGAGTDQVQVTFTNASSEVNLPVLDLSGFQEVEQFQVNGGIGKVGGEVTFNQIDVVSGRLIGASGSIITADVDVAPGGTFGSAGTVVGNIAVASGGTLSPGASPAIMTVVGDISLASGSITTFEFVPAPGQSDQLIVDGNLTIAANAVLDLIGNRPLTPGLVHDMIIADSIDGEFTIGAWDQSAVQGFLRYIDGATDDRLQLMGTFLAAEGTSAQAVAAIDYVNGLLISGEADTTLLEAVPSLLAPNGYANGAAFSLVTPEPYAAASQLGVENGLSITKLFRSGVAASSLSEPQLFTFAGALGNWRPVRGNGSAGTSRAKNDGYGMAGGIGYGSQSGSIAAFIGYLDSEQRIKELGAKTDADGVIAGINGNIMSGGFNLSALLAYDWSSAKTKRIVPGNIDVASGKYDLRSLVLDATAAYTFALSDGWAIEPQVGITHISTRRGSTIETGSQAFALEIDKKRLSATFLDGAIRLRGGQKSDAMFQPWLQLGVRHQMEGNLPRATAAFAGMDSSFTVLGAARKETVLTAGAGFSGEISSNFRILAAYQGEFGGGTGTQLNVGINLAF